MSSQTARISITGEIKTMLDELHKEYPALTPVEIFKVSLGKLYNSYKEQKIEKQVQILKNSKPLYMVDDETEKAIAEAEQNFKEGKCTTLDTDDEEQMNKLFGV